MSALEQISQPVRTAPHSRRRCLQEILDLVDFPLLSQDGFSLVCPPEKCLLLLHIHVLPSTVAFFERLIDLGFDANSIVIIPKAYSTIDSVQRTLRKDLGCTVVSTKNIRFKPGEYSLAAMAGLRKGVQAGIRRCKAGPIRRCVLVDDGGLLTDVWCREDYKQPDLAVVSVQQTESGMYWRRLSSPATRICVARSPAKVLFESKIIVQGVLNKILNLHLLKAPQRLGVIGLGNIGSRLAGLLIERGHEVVGYDINPVRWPSMPRRQQSWRSCVENADIVLGCTGRNTMHHIVETALSLKERKTFISLSSRDVEFQTLLERGSRVAQGAPFGTIEIPTSNGARHNVLNGGFPINFDRTQEWESGADIALTRALVMLGILQGLCTPSGCTYEPQDLALAAQKVLVQKWLDLRGQSPEDYGISDFGTSQWWRGAARPKQSVHSRVRALDKTVA